MPRRSRRIWPKIDLMIASVSSRCGAPISLSVKVFIADLYSARVIRAAARCPACPACRGRTGFRRAARSARPRRAAAARSRRRRSRGNRSGCRGRTRRTCRRRRWRTSPWRETPAIASRNSCTVAVPISSVPRRAKTPLIRLSSPARCKASSTSRRLTVSLEEKAGQRILGRRLREAAAEIEIEDCRAGDHRLARHQRPPGDQADDDEQDHEDAHYGKKPTTNRRIRSFSSAHLRARIGRRRARASARRAAPVKADKNCRSMRDSRKLSSLNDMR